MNRLKLVIFACETTATVILSVTSISGVINAQQFVTEISIGLDQFKNGEDTFPPESIMINAGVAYCG